MRSHSRLTALGILILGLIAAPASAQVVISQVYGGGGNSGAPLNRDYVELFNRGDAAAALAGLSVQYTSATGTGNFGANSGLLVVLPAATLQPGQYFLVALASGSNGAALPAPDATGTINMSGSSGKVALVESTAGLGCNGGSTPCSPEQLALIRDLVGYGSANFFEGSAVAPGLSNSTAALRGDAGCTDTDHNGADFVAGAPAPRNSAVAVNPCSGGGLPTLGIDDVSADEGDAGTTVFAFTARLAVPAATDVTFDVATVDGSATVADGDYVARAETGVVIAAGDTEYRFEVTVNGDTAVEPDEQFGVVLSNVAGATLGQATGTGTIVSDDFELLTIGAVQGSGNASPYAGQIVTVEGIVTARRFNNGFFVQSADGADDGDPLTSDGIFVFTSSAPPAAAAVGNRVRVTATAVEFTPGSNPHQLSLTELSSPTVTALATGQALPAPIVLTAADFDPAGAVDRAERYEGMRVSMPALRVVGPADGFITESQATSSSNGRFYGVIDGVARPRREEGVGALDVVPFPPGVTPPVFDTNPERIRVDSRGQIGASALAVDVDALVTGLTGVLDYGFGAYTVLPDPEAALAVDGGAMPSATPVPGYETISVGSFNLLRFFDTVNDPGTSDPVLTAEALQRRLRKTGNAICAHLHTPDILGVVEVENLAVLQQLADAINANLPGSCADDPQYVAYLVEGNDIGGIDVGFLVSSAEVLPGVPRVEVHAVTQEGADVQLQDPDGSLSDPLNDRPALVLEATVHQDNGAGFDLTVIANHLRSLNGINSLAARSDSWGSNGARVRGKRAQQALWLADYVQQRQVANPDERIVLVGDFNAFEVNDGYTDVMGVITGREAAADQVLVHVDSPIATPLTNLTLSQPEAERYSFVFDGNAQTLDHIVANQALLDTALALRLEHARINADFGVDNFGDDTVPVRASDHDPVVAHIDVPAFRTAGLSLAANALAPSVHVGGNAQFTVRADNAGPNAALDAVLDLAINAAPTQVAVGAASGWSCAAPVAMPDGAGVHCERANFEVGSAEFTVDVQTDDALGGQTLVLHATLDSAISDSDEGDNVAEASVLVEAAADLALRIVGPPLPVAIAGLPSGFGIGVANGGGDAAWQPRLVLAVNAPAADITPIAAAPWNCDVQALQEQRSEVACSVAGSYPAGARDGIVLLVRAPHALAPRGRLLVEGSVISTTPDPDADNNADAASVRVVGRGSH